MKDQLTWNDGLRWIACVLVASACNNGGSSVDDPPPSEDSTATESSASASAGSATTGGSSSATAGDDDSGSESSGGPAVDDPCLGQPLVIDRTRVETTYPAGVRVRFRVLDCQGNGVACRPDLDFDVINDESGESFYAMSDGSSASEPGTPLELRLYSLLMLDFSESVFAAGAAQDVVDGAKAYVDRVIRQAPGNLRHHVAVLAFGGPESTELVVPFTQDADALDSGIDLLIDEPRGSTDLYGAYVTALSALDGAAPPGAIAERFLVLHTDGTHETGNAEAARENALFRKADSDALICAVGIAGDYNNAEIEELTSSTVIAGQSSCFLPDVDSTGLGAALQQIGDKAERRAQGNYGIGICTPLVFGSPTVTVQASTDAGQGSATLNYDVGGFTGQLMACNENFAAVTSDAGPTCDAGSTACSAWIRQLPGAPVSMAVAADGSIYASGEADEFIGEGGHSGFGGGFVRKLDEFGGNLWVRQFDPFGPEGMRVGSMAADDDRVVAVGRTTVSATEGALAELDPETGAVQSVTVFSGVPPISRLVLGDADTVGFVYEQAGDSYLASGSLAGTLTWAHNLGRANATALVFDPTSGSLVAGGNFGDLAPYTPFVTRRSSDGTEEWTFTAGSFTPDDFIPERPGGIALDGSGNVYKVGTVSEAVGDQPFLEGQADVLLASYTPDGVERWTRLVGSTGAEIGTTAVWVEGQGLVFAGITNSLWGGQQTTNWMNAFVGLATEDGELTYVEQFDGIYTEIPWALAARDGRIYMAGETEAQIPGGAGDGAGFIRRICLP